MEKISTSFCMDKAIIQTPKIQRKCTFNLNSDLIKDSARVIIS